MKKSTILSKEEMRKILGGNDPSPEIEGGSGTCSTGCDSGYYACCNTNGSAQATCKCYKDGTAAPGPCGSGGAGSSSCSVS